MYKRIQLGNIWFCAVTPLKVMEMGSGSTVNKNGKTIN